MFAVESSIKKRTWPHLYHYKKNDVVLSFIIDILLLAYHQAPFKIATNLHRHLSQIHEIDEDGESSFEKSIYAYHFYYYHEEAPALVFPLMQSIVKRTD